MHGCYREPYGWKQTNKYLIINYTVQGGGGSPRSNPYFREKPKLSVFENGQFSTHFFFIVFFWCTRRWALGNLKMCNFFFMAKFFGAKLFWCQNFLVPNFWVPNHPNVPMRWRLPGAPPKKNNSFFVAKNFQQNVKCLWRCKKMFLNVCKKLFKGE